ncbi:MULTISPECIES: hypothetical protein [Thiomicrorhabdus]|uniref:Exonuclease domain-containing protein n=1 Tax=Thiomicrorhabdus heinhorstiae TaxID=2748010 RepID=A0ABS0BVJ5_9GAMM|nr:MULTISPECIES: hypothetical protein [Thiomicrorhabdus]MBF6057095.1 hypothetical protein [Thiomicrorhabdus heinhorstiae]
MARAQKSPFIIDLEASGFGPDSYPIEVGLVLADGYRFCTLIQPIPEWTYWDDEAEKVHRISREILHKYGKPVDEVADILNELLRGMTLFSDGWVVDQPWLNKLFYAAGRRMEFFISPLEIILTERQMEIWHDAKDQLLSETELQRHRASNDAWIIQETFKRTQTISS